MLPGRCAGIPPRRRRAEDAARGSRSVGPSAVRPGQGRAASGRWPGTSRAPTSPTTSTAARRAWASPRRRGRPRSGTSSARPWGRRRSSRFEGEFAMTEGHAQELKTQAIALQVGKRLRIFLSDNNAGIDDSLIGGVVPRQVQGLPPGRPVDLVRVERVLAGRRSRLRPDRRRAQDDGGVGSGGSPADDRHRQDHQGLLARRGGRQDSRGRRSGGGLSEPSLRDEDELGVLRRAGPHLRAALRRGVLGHPAGGGDRSARAAGPVQDQHRRRRCRCSSATASATGWPIAWWRSATRSRTTSRSASTSKRDPFLDDRLRVANLPEEPQTLTVRNSVSGAEKQLKIALFRKAARWRARAGRSPRSSSG